MSTVIQNNGSILMSAAVAQQITIGHPKPRKLIIQGADQSLLEINFETREVTAPSLEAASEAGRVFVESVRRNWGMM